jgi:hypothetical protein
MLCIYAQESNRETDKADGFADDCTVITKLEYDSLSSLKAIISHFGIFSGLKCNLEKTFLLPVGSSLNDAGLGDELMRISDLGFKITDKIDLLGIKITNNFEDLYNNFVDVKIAIEKTAAFWERFNLSLSGRIAIGKSLLISKVTYLGSILSPPQKIAWRDSGDN